jgi:CubicO group peptidase (beta-lactamase class C family)
VALLTKPIVSCAVLQLADAGVLDLDEPLNRSIASVVPNDPLPALTALPQVLTHTYGLQNIREKGPGSNVFRSWLVVQLFQYGLHVHAVRRRSPGRRKRCIALYLGRRGCARRAANGKISFAAM